MTSREIEQVNRRQMVAQMKDAEQVFLSTMNIIKHGEMPFADKQIVGQNYAIYYPLWAWNIHMIEDALEAINPEYAGKTKWVVGGIVEWRKS